MNKGNYYKYRTKKYFINEGYSTEYVERNQRIFIKGQIIFKKQDVFGADGVSMKKDQIVFWQCKLNKKNIAPAVKEFKKFPFPKFVDRWIIVWIPRAREPQIIKVT